MRNRLTQLGQRRLPFTSSRLPLVSVIIPAYNSTAWLADAIESALDQTYPNFEVIFVNDGSTDLATRQIACRYLPHITYIERENGGVAAARNSGIAASSGELIALLDQDDKWLPHKLETQVQAFLQRPHVGLVHSSYHLIDEDGRRVSTGGDRNWLSRLSEREYQPLPHLLIDVPICSATTLFPRLVLDEVGMFDPTLSGTDDWDLWLRIAAQGYTFYCLGESLAEYRRHRANTSHNINLMVSGVLGTLDKFYSMPHVPSEARQWRNRVYAYRHAWAAALFYGAGSLGEAGSHLLSALHSDPNTIAQSRFMQSLIYASGEQPTYRTAQQAADFVQQTVSSVQIGSSVMRKVRAYEHLALSLHSGAAIRSQLAHLAGALWTHPGLVVNRTLWASIARKAMKAIKQPMRKYLRQSGTSMKKAASRFSPIVKLDKTDWSPWSARQADFKYGGTMSLATLIPNSSHGRMIEMIPRGARVLETGCANGRFSRVLVEHGCRVVGVEIDPHAAAQATNWCDQVIVGNLEDLTVQEQIPGQFDVVLFGDVLEHLARPWDVLRAIRSHLTPGGCIVASVPNVAHWDVRMDLLRGNFNYQYDGLLDSTHLRFFTRQTLWEIMEQTGYRIMANSRVTTLPAWIYSIRLVRRFAPPLVLPLLERVMPNLVTFQFVVKAVPSGMTKREP